MLDRAKQNTGNRGTPIATSGFQGHRWSEPSRSLPATQALSHSPLSVRVLSKREKQFLCLNRRRESTRAQSKCQFPCGGAQKSPLNNSFVNIPQNLGRSPFCDFQNSPSPLPRIPNVCLRGFMAVWFSTVPRSLLMEISKDICEILSEASVK